jgi:hypothetical protein
MNEDAKLTHWIEKLEGELDEMTKNACYNDNAYVTFDDIKNMSSVTEHEDEALIVIKASPGTNLEVPEPDTTAETEEAEKYKIYLTTNSGEILVYVVSN